MKVECNEMTGSKRNIPIHFRTATSPADRAELERDIERMDGFTFNDAIARRRASAGFRITLRRSPECRVPDEIALRRLLKALLRNFGFVAVDVREVENGSPVFPDADRAPERTQTRPPGNVESTSRGRQPRSRKSKGNRS